MIVSLAMIVRDEERSLPRCLDSVRGAADDIVVIDTGSTDRTRQVAASYGARVFEFHWRKDFGAARQHAFDRAVGEWIFWLDADDVVTNAEAIRRQAASAPRDLKGYYWRYVVARDAGGRSICEFWRERLVRNDGSFRWSGRIHEALVAPPSTRVVRGDDVVVFHEPDVQRKDRCRNIDILADEYERTREHPDPRLLLYMGFEYAGLGDVDLAIGFLRRFLARSSWAEQNYFVRLRIAALLRQRAEYAQAIEEARAATRILPNWPHAYFSLAESSYFLQDWRSVVTWSNVGRQMPIPDPLCPHDPMDVRFRWIIHFTNALCRLGGLAEALQWTETALAICPDDAWHLHNRAFFRSQISAGVNADLVVAAT